MNPLARSHWLRLDAAGWGASTCQNWLVHQSHFERNFSAGDLVRLVSYYYHPECLVVGEGIGRFEGHEGARGFFGGAIATWSACELITEQIIPTAGGAIEVRSAKLTSREDAEPATFVYAVSWRRENSGAKADIGEGQSRANSRSGAGAARHVHPRCTLMHRGRSLAGGYHVQFDSATDVCTYYITEPLPSFALKLRQLQL